MSQAVVGSRKKYKLEVTETDIKVTLEALGSSLNYATSHGRDGREIQRVIDKIYKAMGVNL